MPQQMTPGQNMQSQYAQNLAAQPPPSFAQQQQQGGQAATSWLQNQQNSEQLAGMGLGALQARSMVM